METEKTQMFYLSKEEKLTLENSALRTENLRLLLEKEQKNQLELIDSVCKRLSKQKEDIVALDINSGTIQFKEKEDVTIRDDIS